MLLATEGVITTVLSVVSFFTLTDRPAIARWLSQEEKVRRFHSPFILTIKAAPET
jgi:hypothetical protein